MTDNITTAREGWIVPRRILLSTIIAALFLFIWYEHKYILLVFAGLLLAIALNTLTAWVAGRTPLNRKISYVVILLLLSGLTVGIVLSLAPRVIGEIGQMAKVIPGALHTMRDYLAQRDWGRFLLGEISNATRNTHSAAMVKTIAKGVIDGVEGLVVILAVGFFAALAPHEYRVGAMQLLPERHRQRAEQVLSDVIYTLRWWLAGQMVPMFVLGSASMLCLWLLHVPLAFTLGLITGLLIFVPYVGALASEIPAVLVGLTVSPSTALYVLILYLGIHIAEGYLLTPFVQKRAVRLPPLLTLLSQLFFWSMAGLAGVLVATPLAAAGLVLVKSLYLGERVRR